jgi:hypothetical protein
VPTGKAKDKGVDLAKRRCFVVSAFGANAEEQKRYKQVLRHLVQKVLGSKFQVVRADEIDDEGLITNQVIEHLIEDDLVVADLTGLNPNVFYEIAVRHAARKPIVHLITAGQDIPFDVANMRAVPYALDDPDALETAQQELRRKVQAIEENDWKAAPNPISAARDVWLLQESEQPEAREAGDILAAVGEIRDEVRSLGRRVAHGEESAPVQVAGYITGILRNEMVAAVAKNEPTSEEELGRLFPMLSRGELWLAVKTLLDEKEIYLVDGKLCTIPF